MKTITIGGREIPMVRNALSPIIYREIFHKDYLEIVSKLDDTQIGLTGQLYTEMAFVMAMQATKNMEELVHLRKTDYYAWVNQFEDPHAIEFKIDEIASFYEEQEFAASSAKKEEG